MAVFRYIFHYASYFIIGGFIKLHDLRGKIEPNPIILLHQDCLELEKIAQIPLDIEFVVSNTGRVYYVQSRHV